MRGFAGLCHLLQRQDSWETTTGVNRLPWNMPVTLCWVIHNKFACWLRILWSDLEPMCDNGAPAWPNIFLLSIYTFWSVFKAWGTQLFETMTTPNRTLKITVSNLWIFMIHGTQKNTWSKETRSFQWFRSQGTLPASLMRHQPPGTGHRSACATNHSSKSDTELPSLGNQKRTPQQSRSQKFEQSRQVHRMTCSWICWEVFWELNPIQTEPLWNIFLYSTQAGNWSTFLSATFIGLGNWSTRSRWMDWGSYGKGVFKAWHLSCANPWRQSICKVLGESHGWRLLLGRLLDFSSYIIYSIYIYW